MNDARFLWRLKWVVAGFVLLVFLTLAFIGPLLGAELVAVVRMRAGWFSFHLEALPSAWLVMVVATWFGVALSRFTALAWAGIPRHSRWRVNALALAATSWIAVVAIMAAAMLTAASSIRWACKPSWFEPEVDPCAGAVNHLATGFQWAAPCLLILALALWVAVFLRTVRRTRESAGDATGFIAYTMESGQWPECRGKDPFTVARSLHLGRPLLILIPLMLLLWLPSQEAPRALGGLAAWNESIRAEIGFDMAGIAGYGLSVLVILWFGLALAQRSAVILTALQKYAYWRSPLIALAFVGWCMLGFFLFSSGFMGIAVIEYGAQCWREGNEQFRCSPTGRDIASILAYGFLLSPLAAVILWRLAFTRARRRVRDWASPVTAVPPSP